MTDRPDVQRCGAFSTTATAATLVTLAVTDETSAANDTAATGSWDKKPTYNPGDRAVHKGVLYEAILGE